MNINELARDFIAARKDADWANMRELGWQSAKIKELQLAAQIRSWLLHKPVVVSDDPAVKQLLKEIDLAGTYDSHETGWNLLYDLVSPEEYVAALAEIILIVPTGNQIPGPLRALFEEARRCYALGQFAAVQSLCRTILESTVNEIGILTGEWTKKQLHTHQFRKGYSFKDRVDLIAGDASNQIYDLYKDLCGVVHGTATSSKHGVPKSLTMTVDFVQYLYEQHNSGQGA